MTARTSWLPAIGDRVRVQDSPTVRVVADVIRTEGGSVLVVLEREPKKKLRDVVSLKVLEAVA